MLEIQIIGANRVRAKLDELSPSIRAKLQIFISQFVPTLKEKVQANISANFRSSGRLFNSVRSETSHFDNGSFGVVYTDPTVPYAAIQESGGRTPPHVITPRSGQALAFMGGGEGARSLTFAKRVNHPGATIVGRPYASLALAQLRGTFEGGIREIVDEAIAEASL